MAWILEARRFQRDAMTTRTHFREGRRQREGERERDKKRHTIQSRWDSGSKATLGAETWPIHNIKRA